MNCSVVPEKVCSIFLRTGIFEAKPHTYEFMIVLHFVVKHVTISWDHYNHYQEKKINKSISRIHYQFISLPFDNQAENKHIIHLIIAVVVRGAGAGVP